MEEAKLNMELKATELIYVPIYDLSDTPPPQDTVVHDELKGDAQRPQLVTSFEEIQDSPDLGAQQP